ncbi:PQQ-binding-like beta-propeller repeat protein, partial [bacterium]|nr:PQQ-binding-like beta-propeller repeat protein [bacterium]
MKKVIFTLLAILLIAPIQAQDWTKWHGPHADGSTTAEGFNPKVLDNPQLEWLVNVGKGHSSLVVKGAFVWTMGNRPKEGKADQFEDVVSCLNQSDGSVKWEYVYPCEPGEDPGPGSTPVWDDGRLYTLSRLGHLFCLNAANGNVIWQRHLIEEAVGQTRPWGYAGSPVIWNDLLILNINQSGVAMNKLTGEKVWKSEKGESNFASPVLYEHQDDHWVLFPVRNKLYAREIETGKLMWTHSLRGGEGDPLCRDGHIIFPGRSTAWVDIVDGKPKNRWENTTIWWTFITPVQVGDYLYGFSKFDMQKDEHLFQCLNLKDGTMKWSHTFEIYGGIIAAGGYLFGVTGQGLVFVAVSTEVKTV